MGIFYWFKIKLNITEIIVGGWLTGLVILTLVIFWLSFLLSFSKVMIWLTVVLSFGVGIWKLPVKKLLRQKFKWSWKSGGLLVFWLSLFLIIWKQALVKETDGWYSGCGNCFGDWAAHLAYTTSFAFGDNFPPQLPILAHTKFSYPFLVDFLSAILIKMGANLVSAIVVPGFILSLLLVMGLYLFGKRVSGKVKVGWLTSLIFLFNGGLGFWWWRQGNPPMDYTHLGEKQIFWINTIISKVMPQRGFLWGFAVAIVIYLLLWKAMKKRQKEHLMLAGMLTAGLVMIHMHSFLVIVLVTVILMIMKVIEAKNKFGELKKWLWFFMPMVFLGLPQVGYFYNLSVGRKFLTWQPGWMAGSENVIWFWFKNVGLAWLVIIAAFKGLNKKLKLFSIPFWLVFILANLWLFQPYDWDNSKLFDHWYLIMAVMMAMVINRLFEKKNWLVKIVGVMGLIGIVLSGTLDVFKMTQYDKHKYRFWDQRQLKLAEWVKDNTKNRAVFLTNSNHNNWVASLAGRKIVLGYRGWLWTYGLNYQEQEIEVEKMFAAKDEVKKLLDKYQIDYVVIGPEERAEFKELNQEYFDNKYNLVLADRKTRIYKITE